MAICIETTALLLESFRFDRALSGHWGPLSLSHLWMHTAYIRHGDKFKIVISNDISWYYQLDSQNKKIKQAFNLFNYRLSCTGSVEAHMQWLLILSIQQLQYQSPNWILFILVRPPYFSLVYHNSKDCLGQIGINKQTKKSQDNTEHDITWHILD